jgi:ABC-type glycerol-3-phosphate transport system permease component
VNHVLRDAHRSWGSVTLHATVIVLAGAFALPFIWMVRGATADRFAPLRHLWREQPIGTWLLNSIFLAATYTVLVVLICSLAGFAIAKYDFRGKRLMMVVMLLTVAVPPQVLLPAGFELVAWLGWVNTYPAAIVPGLANVFGVLLFSSAMRSVSDDLLAAARLDGCGEFRLWWHVALPLARPMVGAFALMSFLGAWNSFLWPQVVLIDAARHTLPIGLATLAGLPQDGPGLLYAAVLVGILPVAVLFFALQRDFVAGLTSGATNE